MNIIRLVFLSLLFPLSFAAQFESGENINISQAYDDDYYAAAGELSVDAVISGDMIAAGGQISVTDSIGEDLTLAGGELTIRGPVGDDLRSAGGQIRIDSSVGDDAVIFGGEIEIGPDAVIAGDLVVFGGEIVLNGTVLGAVRASGGEIEINGTVHGPSRLTAENIQIGEQARFQSDVQYWSGEGEIDFGSSMHSGTARYDDTLAWEGKDYSDSRVGYGFGILFSLVFLLGGFLLLMLLNWAFGAWFGRAASEVRKDWVKSLGSGLIYILGLPVLIIFGFMIVIGIPLSLFLFFFYIFSLVFGIFVVSLITTYFLRSRGAKDWGYWKVVLISFLIALGIQLLSAIPFLGFVICFVIITIAYGAIGLALKNNATAPGPIVHV